jgi:hypothetical protein
MFNDWTDYKYQEERQANDDGYTGWMEKVFEPSFPMDRRHSDGKKILGKRSHDTKMSHDSRFFRFQQQHADVYR